MQGRPPTGEGGELLSEYKRTTVRLPPDVQRLLKAVAKKTGDREWQILVAAIREYAGRVLKGDTNDGE